jgi:nicotinate phosphoribosyltransferase
VAAARAAYIGGLASTSNLEAGRRYGIPTAGTTAHAFVLLFAEEHQAFEAQLATLGPDTTLLVDTFDTPAAIRVAVESAGTGLGAVRIDSGDLGAEAVRARQLLDSLGATDTRIVVTGDLDENSIARLAGTPVDAYGAGTSVVMGSGHATCGFVYKLVEVDGRAVEKRSPGKATVGGRKRAFRRDDGGADVVTTGSRARLDRCRPLQVELVRGGTATGTTDLDGARQLHRDSRAALGPDRQLLLDRM